MRLTERQESAVHELVEADKARIAASDDVLARLDLGNTTAGTFEVRDPATDSAIARVPNLGPDDALSAVAAAHAAGLEWSRTSPRARADVLRRWYDLLVDNADDIALLISREMGKAPTESRAEVSYGADFVRWYSEEAVRPAGTTREVPAGGAQLLTRRAPVGLSVLITPWNFPLAMATRKMLADSVAPVSMSTARCCLNSRNRNGAS
jgi:succinate-semialdehyde dehydrogenase/glutarate-semialdehyde dehydrogenase